MFFYRDLRTQDKNITKVDQMLRIILILNMFKQDKEMSDLLMIIHFHKILQPGIWDACAVGFFEQLQIKTCAELKCNQLCGGY